MRSEEKIREEIDRLEKQTRPVFCGSGYRYVQKNKKRQQINYEVIKALNWVLNEEQSKVRKVIER